MNFSEILKRLALSFMAHAVLMTAIYYIFGYNSILAIITLFPFIYFGFKKTLLPNIATSINPQPIQKSSLLIVIGFLEIFILSSAFFARSSEPLITPWQVLSFTIFPAYALASGLILIYSQVTERYTSFLLTLHAASTYGLAWIIFSNGFGYDPHVHRAAMEHIWQFGILEPKTPYYIGQYLLVLTLHALTGLPIGSIDAILTPLAALALPVIALKSLQTSYGFSRSAALYGAQALFLIPNLAFTFSVPHNLASVIFLIVILVGPGAKTRTERLQIALLGFFALSLHPLLGLPSLILALTLPKFESKKVRIISSLVLIFSIPLLFALHQLTQGQSALTFLNPFSRVEIFLALFQDPFAGNSAGLFWTVVYLIRQSFPTLIFSGAMIGCLLAQSKLRQQTSIIFLSMLTSLFIFSTLFIFPGILPHEQAEYALRYKNALALVLLPALMFFFSFISQKSQLGVLIIIFTIAPLALYFSYPTFDPKSSIAAWNVSRADYEAVRLVQKISDQKSYLVLSNSITALAALETLGFELVQNKKFPYQIHDQGYLAETYREFLETPTKQKAQEIIKKNRVCSLFVMTSRYEPWFNSLTETASQNSDANFKTSDEVIHIYQYKSSEATCK